MTESRRLHPYPYTPPPQIAVDLGGTHCRIALADHGVLRPGSIRRLKVAGHAGLKPILAEYMQAQAVVGCAGLCIAAAGPVQADSVRMTNLGWVIEAGALAELTDGAPVRLLNDLQAQGHALDGILPGHLRPLVMAAQPARHPARETRLVVGMGTGFNAAVVHPLARGALVPPAEAGHMHLPAQDRDERAFSRALAARHGLATVEEALSGRGLEAIHAWLTGQALDAAAITANLDAGQPEARASGALFARLLGRVLADLALAHLPWGGIYLVGGVARAMGPHLPGLGLAGALCQMGRQSALMERFSVHLVDDDYAALTGCARFLEHSA
ncbi:MAG: glucokinase [Pararhodobacter sp.]